MTLQKIKGSFCLFFMGAGQDDNVNVDVDSVGNNKESITPAIDMLGWCRSVVLGRPACFLALVVCLFMPRGGIWSRGSDLCTSRRQGPS